MPMDIGGLVVALDDFLTAVETIRRHMMATMGFAGRSVDGQGRLFQAIVPTAHVALRA